MQENEIRDAGNFTEAIKLSSKRLGFSVTKACPLRCSHCSVSADPKLGHTTYPPSFTVKVVSEMPDIASAGIRYIDFTGGEPVLAEDFVTNVAKAAKSVGIQTGIVTAAHWAFNREKAKKTIEKFIDIDGWDISTDVYHLDFVSLEKVQLAYDLLKHEYGKAPLIRVAYHEPFTEEDCKLILQLDQLFGRDIGFQPIGPVGRARSFVDDGAATPDSYDKSPCPSTGLLIQPFGIAVSCCAPLSHEDYDHPLRLGNAFQEPLAIIINRWRTNPLLQTIRLWGFEPVINWLEEANYPLEKILKDKSCQTCVSLIQDRNACDIAFSRASEFLHKLSLGLSLKKYFGEDEMEKELVMESKTYADEMYQ